MKTELVHRTVDNKYVIWGYTVDPTYDSSLVTEHTIPFIPQRWIMLGVFKTENEAKAFQQRVKSDH